MILTKQYNGFIATHDKDFEELEGYISGQQYKIKATKERNPDFHRKYFAMLRMAFTNLPERYDGMFPNTERFRKAILLATGHTEEVMTFDGEILLEPKSLSFGAMDDVEFREVYNDTVDWLIKNIWPAADQERMQSLLMSYL